MTLRLVVGVVAIGSLAACASGGSKAPAAAPSTAAAANTTSPKRGSANLITQSEIEAAHLEMIYDVIERLRPNMMRTRGQMGRVSDSGTGMSTIKVYLNGTMIGDISMLRSIQASSVKQVEFLNSSDATTRFGTGVDAGAIVITQK